MKSSNQSAKYSRFLMFLVSKRNAFSVLMLTLFLILGASLSQQIFMDVTGRMLACQPQKLCLLHIANFQIELSFPFYTFVLLFCIAFRFLSWSVFELWGLWTSQELFAKLISRLKVTKLEQIECRSGADIVSVFTRDFGKIKLDAVIRFGDVINSGSEFLILCIFLSRDKPFLLVAVLPLFLVFNYLANKLQKSVARNGAILSALSGLSLEANVDLVRGWFTNSVFGTWDYFLNRAQRRYSRFMKAEIFEFDVLSWGRFSVGLCGLIYSSIIVTAIGMAFASGSLNAAVAGAMLGLVFRMRSVSDWFFWSLSSMQEAFAGFARVDELLNLPAETNVKVGSIEFESDSVINGNAISFVNYSASYHSSLPLVLNRVSFEIPSFSKVAVIAPTGQGKSSIVQALFGQMHTHSGDINICKLSAIENDLRQFISVATQFQFIIEGTLEDNLTLGRKIDFAQMQTVLELLREFNFENHSSNLKEAHLTASEKAFIGIGRTLLSDASILIFDEPFACLDLVQEKKLGDIFAKLQGKTIIVISHRLGFMADFGYKLSYVSESWVLSKL